MLGAFHFAVETGRYRTSKVPLGERVCNNSKAETEFHFVSKLQNFLNELFFTITKGPNFYAPKQTSIYSENNTCTIANQVNVAQRFSSSFPGIHHLIADSTQNKGRRLGDVIM